MAFAYANDVPGRLDVIRSSGSSHATRYQHLDAHLKPPVRLEACEVFMNLFSNGMSGVFGKTQVGLRRGTDTPFYRIAGQTDVSAICFPFGRNRIRGHALTTEWMVKACWMCQ